MHAKSYLSLLVMTILSFISMYAFMYSMVDSFENVFSSLNQFYMAAVMTAPMVLIEVGIMRAMYKNSAANIAIIAVSLIAFAGSFTAIRMQTAVGDKQFLRSMIPHHAGAILMCEKALIEDAEIKKLCRTIINGQNSEIGQMKAMLARTK